MSKLSIRPHHLLCSFFFEGKGYSQEFIDNMRKVIFNFDNYDTVELTDKCDLLCECCPHRNENVCASNEKVKGFDMGVVKLCSLEINNEYKPDYLKSIVFNNIIMADKMTLLCSSCEWFKICSKKINLIKNK